LRGPDEDLQVSHLVGNRLDDLDAGGTYPHDSHALAFQLDLLLRPARRVEDHAAEALLPGEALLERGRQHPRAAHQELRVEDVTAIAVHAPAASLFLEVGGRDRGAEPKVLAQVQPVRHVAHPALDFRLAGEALCPAPVLVELLVEQVLVDVGFRIELGAGIAIPVPGPADIQRGIHPEDLEAHFAQLVKLVEAGNPGTDYKCIQLDDFARGHCKRAVALHDVPPVVLAFLSWTAPGGCRLAPYRQPTSSLPGEGSGALEGSGTKTCTFRTARPSQPWLQEQLLNDVFRCPCQGIATM